MSMHRYVVALLATLTLVLAGTTTAQTSWLDHPLTDVASGETFTLAEYAGAALLVETMATWCGNCRRQLGHLTEARETLEGEGIEVAYVAVSVERGLAPEALAAYADRQAFPFRFAVADDAFLQLLADRFGRRVLSPPSTPHVIVASDGTVSELRTGFTSPDELVALLADATR